MVLTEKEEQRVKRKIRWSVGENKRYNSLDELIDYIKEIDNSLLGFGGCFGIEFKRLLPYLKENREELKNVIKEQ